MTTSQLESLKQATDDAIRAAHRKRREISGAINWADLHCLQAAWVVTDDEYDYAEVTIEEASPECSEFHAFIHKYLAAHGWPDVSVVTEW